MPGEYESLVSVDVWTMIFAWVNIIILYFILKKLLFKPIKKMIDTRQQEIDGMYADANQSKTEAEALKTEYETKLDSAKEESEQILRDATRKAQLKGEEILQEAQESAAHTIKRAEEQIELEKKQALNDMKDEVSDLAVDIASAVLEKNVSKEDNNELIDSFIDHLGEDS